MQALINRYWPRQSMPEIETVSEEEKQRIEDERAAIRRELAGLQRRRAELVTEIRQGRDT